MKPAAIEYSCLMVSDPGTPLVAGRTCGACNACCHFLKIDEPQFRKPPAQLCNHWHSEKACTIYDRRPPSCRDFYCGWLQFDWLDETWRPDRCGILVRPVTQNGGVAVIFLLIASNDALDTDQAAIVIGNVVASDILAFLEVPGPPGYMGARMELNAMLRAPVDRGDLAEIRRLLVLGAEQARHHDMKPARYDH